MGRRPARLVVCALVLGLAGVGQPLRAQSPDPAENASPDPTPQGLMRGSAPATADEAEAELERIRNSITISQQRAEELRTQIEEFAADRAALNAELIAAAQRVTAAEAKVSVAEGTLLDLRAEESAILRRLDARKAQIAELLAALQRLGRTPPPALIVDPADAMGSARAALLLSSVLPQMRERADAIAADLAELETVKAEATAEVEALRADLQTLSEEKLRIGTLIEARRQRETRAEADLAAEQAEAERLASRASSLNGLIANLENQIGSVSAALDAAEAAAAPDLEAPAPERAEILTAFARTDRTEPAVPFPRAQGFLTQPVSGVKVLEFGGDDGFGGTAKGTSIVTRAEAQVVAPADGWVVYRGPYLNYGQIVILNTGNDYNILLAGLESISVSLGQFVLMGEPVGRMGTRTLGQTVATSAGMSRPTLYIEFRNNGDPVDPGAWWAPTDQASLKG